LSKPEEYPKAKLDDKVKKAAIEKENRKPAGLVRVHRNIFVGAL
jgi:hypothetical protein